MAKHYTPVSSIRPGQSVMIDDAADDFHRGFDGWHTVLWAYRGRPTQVDMMLTHMSPNPTNAAYVQQARAAGTDERSGITMVVVDPDTHAAHVVHFPDPRTTLDVFTVALDEAA